MLFRCITTYLGLITVFILIPTSGLTHEISAPKAAADMVRAAVDLLDALSPEQQEEARFRFDDNERFDWQYIPWMREGLALKDMTAEQRRLALAFLKAGLGQKGYFKATIIMELEAVLREIETWNWLGRDPDKYYFSFFGQPSKSGTWGWRVEGHHLSLNFTIVNGHLFATAPRFLGANPARVSGGELKGMRALADEEDLARKLVKSLDRNQRKRAVFRTKAFRDIVTGSDEEVAPPEVVGISAAEFREDQKALLFRIIEEYLAALPPEISRHRLDTIRKIGLNSIHFGWAGGLEAGQPHYYRIQSPSFLIEYDNVQNNANHIHCVWRDFKRDFGRDLLREHYRAAHQ